MPPHLHYVEPYAGSLAVLLARDPNDPRFWASDHSSTRGVSEVVNDIDGELATFWRVLRCPAQFPRFAQKCEATPFSQDAWEVAAAILRHPCDDEALIAWAFFVHVRLSLAGRRDTFAPISRTRTRRGMNEQASAWLTCVEGLPAVHERLKRVVVLNRDGCEVIRQQDGPLTCFYVDPPYVAGTRAAPDVYSYEMSCEQHEQLLQVLRAAQGKVLLSGYRCELYDDLLHDWKRVDFDVALHSAGGKQKRRATECLWLNYQPREKK